MKYFGPKIAIAKYILGKFRKLAVLKFATIKLHKAKIPCKQLIKDFEILLNCLFLNHLIIISNNLATFLYSWNCQIYFLYNPHPFPTEPSTAYISFNQLMHPQVCVKKTWKTLLKMNLIVWYANILQSLIIFQIYYIAFVEVTYRIKSRVLTRLVQKHMQAFSDCL